ncbi:MAG TPA: hypothetical protein VFY71_00155 [Planctomycetota bacterium]|nr:hypothetical protein [Planctomycetota bacterium]
MRCGPRLLLALPLLAGVAGGCAGSEPAPAADAALAPLAPLALVPRLELLLEAAPGPGPARAVKVTVRITPTDGLPLDVVPAGGAADSPLLQLTLHWEDFRGDGPQSSGRGTQVLVPFTGLGTASPDAPLTATADVALAPATGVLARRITAEGRLIGVDLVRPDGHSGGRLLALPRTQLASLAPAPPGLLEEHLQSGLPDGIFLAAAGAPPEWRKLVLDRLIGALPSSHGPAREAIFASLLWLTGQTLGRDEHRWSAWWSEERHKAGR